MSFKQLPDCTKCGRSPWAHALRGEILYCVEPGGPRSSFDAKVVNQVRAAIGKKPIQGSKT